MLRFFSDGDFIARQNVKKKKKLNLIDFFAHSSHNRAARLAHWNHLIAAHSLLHLIKLTLSASACSAKVQAKRFAKFQCLSAFHEIITMANWIFLKSILKLFHNALRHCDSLHSMRLSVLLRLVPFWTFPDHFISTKIAYSENWCHSKKFFSLNSIAHLRTIRWSPASCYYGVRSNGDGWNGFYDKINLLVDTLLKS